jgi:hypothetical protein
VKKAAICAEPVPPFGVKVIINISFLAVNVAFSVFL